MLYPLLLDSLLLGIQHSFEPDHVAAVSVLATEKNKENRHMWRLIWRSSHWALGHSFTLIAFACFALLLKSALSLNISEYVQLCIGPLMIWLGVLAIRRNFRPFTPHVHVANQPTVSRSFWVGMVHGLAGTGGACAIALTLAASDAYTAVWIIILQSVGIIVSMTAYGCFFAFSMHRFTQTWEASLRIINYLVGTFSILIGVYTLVEAL